MTPKEKAKELVSKYMEIDLQPFSDYGNYIEKDVAKQCALIAVDEILNTVNSLFNTYSQNDYWLQVKQEIEKL